ncbi:hypothetical protein DMH25_22260 [Streptomyces sp. WAC 01325]|nr:hypothetical protein DMH25_22260 [Streptomyces sp. WAC 01325]
MIETCVGEDRPELGDLSGVAGGEDEAGHGDTVARQARAPQGGRGAAEKGRGELRDQPRRACGRPPAEPGE